MLKPVQFVYDDTETMEPSANAVMTYQESVRHVNATLPANFYSREKRSMSLVSWYPYPGDSLEMVPDSEFIFYSSQTDIERVPSITTFHGHYMMLPFVKVKYVGRGRKYLKCEVSFTRRVWDAEQECTVEETYCTVAAQQGDNNHIHLLEALPGETELDMDYEQFFTETPEMIDQDLESRLARVYGGEVLQALI